MPDGGGAGARCSHTSAAITRTDNRLSVLIAAGSVHALVKCVPDRIALTVSLLYALRPLPASRAVIVPAARSTGKA
jgi:hypothetical protein